MSQVVQSRCPHCQNTLRVPAEWLDKLMRCKFCRSVFQGQARSANGSARPAAAMPLAAAPVAAAPFGFESASAASALPARPRASGGNKLLLLGVGLLVALPLLGLTAAGVGYVAYVHYTAPTDDDVPVVADAEHGGSQRVEKDKGLPKKSADKKLAVGTPGKGLLPRRALLIGVNNYLYLNTVNYGGQSASTGALRDRFQRPPVGMPATQVFELSDGAARSHPTEPTVIKNAIHDFLDSCRGQDRIILVFAGHATDIDKKSYLIPIAGKRDDADTLIPLTWVFNELAKCKARQKIFILDVFRYPPALGFELPGAGASEDGEMGDDFEDNLKSPPEGVQVWCSCSKGQRGIEFEGGSVFLNAIYQEFLQYPANKGITQPADPIPIDAAFVAKVNARIKDMVSPQKFEQVSKLTGSPLSNGAAPNEAEPMPPQLVLKQPPAPGGQSADLALVNGILNELKMLPPVRETRVGENKLFQAANLPPFPAKALAAYKSDDYKFIGDLKDRFKKDEKGFTARHPVRAAVLSTIEALDKSSKVKVMETAGSPIDAKMKKQFREFQRVPALTIFDLEQALADMNEVAEKNMEQETSKRWRANFDFTMARLKARLLYLYEYDYALGDILAERMPELQKNQFGWRIGSSKQIHVNEPKAKKYRTELKKAWERIQKNYPETPWAVIAYRENLVALGLEWRGKSD